MSAAAPASHHHQDVTKFQDIKTVQELRTEITKTKKNIESGNVQTTFCCFGNSDKSKLAKLEKNLEIELAKPLPETKEQEKIIEQEHEHHRHHINAEGGVIAPHGAVDPALAAGAAGFTPSLGDTKTLRVA
jgi:hypothetical protein